MTRKWRGSSIFLADGKQQASSAANEEIDGKPHKEKMQAADAERRGGADRWCGPSRSWWWMDYWGWNWWWKNMTRCNQSQMHFSTGSYILEDRIRNLNVVCMVDSGKLSALENNAVLLSWWAKYSVLASKIDKLLLHFYCETYKKSSYCVGI